MSREKKSLLLVSMPFAETSIPSIQLGLLESYLKERDVTITSRHLYLKAADCYGLHNYNFLINSPNDPYVAQMVFSKYVFPEHWQKNQEKFRNYYENNLCNNNDLLENLSFESYTKQTDRFMEWILNNIQWNTYDIIGFTLNYGQFLSSLAVAKKIKEQYPEKKIVFGGSTSINELGQRILSIFDYIDFIVSGEGEEALFLLTNNFENYHTIPGLIYREKNNAVWNKNNTCIDMNTLPYPCFESYFNELIHVSREILQYHQLYGRLPIELSRGCWWNNCTFCNIGAYNKKYREKNYDRFVDELQFLSDTYHMLDFQVIGTTLPQKGYKDLCEKIMKLNRDFTLIIESRAGSLNSKDYSLLRQAGFTHIQTGIETFSTNYIKKMNKGVRVIDNIAALKFCKENHIKNSYNLIVDYPNEESINFKQTEKNIQLFQKYLEPPNISKFVVGFQSPIYNNLEQFNIEKLEPKIIDTLMYPEEIFDKDFFFFYSCTRKKEIDKNPWERLVSDWKRKYEEQKKLGVKRDIDLEKLVFYYKDGGNFIKIYDKRQGDNAMIYMLNNDERNVFLACTDVISKTELVNNFIDMGPSNIETILNGFVQAGIVYKENEWYVSLPISYQKYYNKEIIKKTESIEEIREYIQNL
ncbi:MAG: RiPP maturation radical SAM C-methyltransferase [Thermoplasmatota archaeon]